MLLRVIYVNVGYVDFYRIFFDWMVKENREGKIDFEKRKCKYIKL